MHFLNPLLNEDEAVLRSAEPEECLRRAVARGAISPESVGAGLPDRVAAVLRHVVAGERLPAPQDCGDEAAAGPAGGPSAGEGAAVGEGRPAVPALPDAARREWEWTTAVLSGFPGLLEALEQGALSPSEAVQAAQAVDGLLGRYLTGTRYAAP